MALPAILRQNFIGRPAGFVGHGFAALNPMSEIDISPLLGLHRQHIVQNHPTAKTVRRHRRVKKTVDQRRAMGEPVAQHDADQTPRLPIFQNIGLQAGGGGHGVIVTPLQLRHLARRMARTQIQMQEVKLLLRAASRALAAQLLIARMQPPPMRLQPKLGCHNAQRAARRAMLASRNPCQRLAAPKALRAEILILARRILRRQRHHQFALLAMGQIGAGRRAGEIGRRMRPEAAPVRRAGRRQDGLVVGAVVFHGRQGWAGRDVQSGMGRRAKITNHNTMAQTKNRQATAK